MYDIIIISADVKESEELKLALLKYQIQKNIDMKIVMNELSDNLFLSQDASIYFVDTSLGQSKCILSTIRDINVDNIIVLLVNGISDLLSVMTPKTMPNGILQRTIAYSDIESLLNQLTEIIKSRDSSVERFVWTIKAHTYTLSMDKILFFESRNKSTYLISAAKEYEVHMTLDVLEDQLPDTFVRIHRSYLVNAEKISEYDYSSMTAIMDDGSKVFISRSGKEKLKGVM